MEIPIPPVEKESEAIPMQFIAVPVKDPNNKAKQLPRPQPPRCNNVNQIKLPNNWFTRTVQQKGEDYFISGKLTPDEVIKRAENILNDIIYGNINYEHQGKYLLLPVILNSLISYCYNKARTNHALNFALNYTLADYYNGHNQVLESKMMSINSIDSELLNDMLSTVKAVEDNFRTYTYLYNVLEAVKQTQNVSLLFKVPIALNNKNNRRQNVY